MVSLKSSENFDRKMLLIFGAILLFAMMFSGSAHADTAILDSIGQTYKSASSSWTSTLFSIAQGLFIKLATLEMLWFGIIFVIEKDDPRIFLVTLLKKMMALLFFYAILLNFDRWIPAVISGFSNAGQQAAGIPNLSPSQVMERGLSLCSTIVSKAKDLGLLEVGPAFLAILVALMVLIAFTVIAGQMLVTLIESYIVVSAGVLFLGFAGSRWTTTFAEKFISYAVSVGVKLFVTYLIIGAGQNLSDQWLSIISNSPDVSGSLTVLAGALVYTFLAFQIPSLASSMLTGSVSMTLGGFAATAGALGAAAVGAAGATAAGALGLTKGGATLGKIAGAAIQNAQAGGSKGLVQTGLGALGAVGAAGAGAIKDGIAGLGGAPGNGLAGRIQSSTAALKESAAAAGVGASAAAPMPPAPSAPVNPSAQPGSSGASTTGGGTSSSPTTGGATPTAESGTAIQTQSVEQAGSTTAPSNVVESATSTSSSAPVSQPANQPSSSGAVTQPSAPVSTQPLQVSAPVQRPNFQASAPSAQQQRPGQPSAPKPTVVDRIKQVSDLPNDAAPGAPLQVNLKHD